MLPCYFAALMCYALVSSELRCGTLCSAYTFEGRPQALTCRHVQVRLPLLWPFFGHSSLDVQYACAACCLQLARCLLARTSSHAPSTAAATPAVLRTMLRLAYQLLLVSTEPRVCTVCEELLTLLLTTERSTVLAAMLDAETLYALMELPSTATGSLLPQHRLLHFPLQQTVVTNRRTSRGSAPVDIGTVPALYSFKNGDQDADRAEEVVAERRVMCARLCGRAGAAAAHSAADADTSEVVRLAAANVRNLVATYLYSTSFAQRSFGALVAMFWMRQHAVPRDAVPHMLRDPVRFLPPLLCCAPAVCWLRVWYRCPARYSDTAAPLHCQAHKIR